MWILIFFLIAVALAGGFTGSQNWFTLDRLNKENVLNGILIILLAFTLLMIMFVLGFFTQTVAAPFMMTVYTFIAGFFFGYGIRLLKIRSGAGNILYQHRSFWIDHAPNFLAMILIIYGIFRTAVLTDQFITGIRLTSGISLISFGFFSWTIKMVPEFRSGGILLLDRFIHWKHVISWRWYSESVIQIDYIPKEDDKSDERIRQFVTSIPEEERKEAEIVIRSRMDQFDEQRKKMLLKDDEG